MARTKTTPRPARKQVATALSISKNRQYHVGSVSKTGHILWMYDEGLTFEEAEVVATSSRLSLLAPGVSATKMLPLNPRAAQRLAKAREEGVNTHVTCDVFAVLTASFDVLKVTESKNTAEIYLAAYNKFRDGKQKATIRQSTVEL